MPRKIRPSALTAKNCGLFLAVCLIFFGSQLAFGQSGRRSTATPTPTPSVPQTAVKTTVPADEPAQTVKPADAAVVRSVLVAGEVVHDYTYYKSTTLDSALKECANRLRNSRRVPNVTKIGKMGFNDAKERAKKENEAYVLWISFVARDDGYGNMLIDYADYALLIPKTGHRLTYGRVKPGERSVVSTGGILGLPKPSNNRRSPYRQMENAVWQITDLLLHGGWFGS